MDFSEGQRRLALEQAIASAKIEGFEPTAEFLEDCEQVIRNEITTEEAINRARKRALSNQRGI